VVPILKGTSGEAKYVGNERDGRGKKKRVSCVGNHEKRGHFLIGPPRSKRGDVQMGAKNPTKKKNTPHKRLSRGKKESCAERKGSTRGDSSP